MTYDQFWVDDPTLCISYRKADSLRRRRTNEELWLSGVYTCDALIATVGNMFNKGKKHEYPSEPRPITAEEIAERKERAQKEKMERIKAAFTARALSMNAKMGEKHND